MIIWELHQELRSVLAIYKLPSAAECEEMNQAWANSATAAARSIEHWRRFQVYRKSRLTIARVSQRSAHKSASCAAGELSKQCARETKARWILNSQTRKKGRQAERARGRTHRAHYIFLLSKQVSRNARALFGHLNQSAGAVQLFAPSNLNPTEWAHRKRKTPVGVAKKS